MGRAAKCKTIPHSRCGRPSLYGVNGGHWKTGRALLSPQAGYPSPESVSVGSRSFFIYLTLEGKEAHFAAIRLALLHWWEQASAYLARREEPDNCFVVPIALVWEPRESW